MSSRLKRFRSIAYLKQDGRCYYCGSPMWSGDAEAFSNNYSIIRAAALRFQCTAEHLVARSEGGIEW